MGIENGINTESLLAFEAQLQGLQNCVDGNGMMEGKNKKKEKKKHQSKRGLDSNRNKTCSTRSGQSPRTSCPRKSRPTKSESLKGRPAPLSLPSPIERSRSTKDKRRSSKTRSGRSSRPKVRPQAPRTPSCSPPASPKKHNRQSEGKPHPHYERRSGHGGNVQARERASTPRPRNVTKSGRKHRKRAKSKHNPKSKSRYWSPP